MEINTGHEESFSCDLYAELITKDHEDENAKQQASLQTCVTDLQTRIDTLLQENAALHEENKLLKANISSLFVTAKREIGRKDAEIVKLRRQLGLSRKRPLSSHSKKDVDLNNINANQVLDERSVREFSDTETERRKHTRGNVSDRSHRPSTSRTHRKDTGVYKVQNKAKSPRGRKTTKRCADSKSVKRESECGQHKSAVYNLTGDEETNKPAPCEYNDKVTVWVRNANSRLEPIGDFKVDALNTRNPAFLQTVGNSNETTNNISSVAETNTICDTVKDSVSPPENVAATPITESESRQQEVVEQTVKELTKCQKSMTRDPIIEASICDRKQKSPAKTVAKRRNRHLSINERLHLRQSRMNDSKRRSSIDRSIERSRSKGTSSMSSRGEIKRSSPKDNVHARDTRRSYSQEGQTKDRSEKGKESIRSNPVPNDKIRNSPRRKSYERDCEKHRSRSKERSQTKLTTSDKKHKDSATSLVKDKRDCVRPKSDEKYPGRSISRLKTDTKRMPLSGKPSVEARNVPSEKNSKDHPQRSGKGDDKERNLDVHLSDRRQEASVNDRHKLLDRYDVGRRSSSTKDRHSPRKRKRPDQVSDTHHKKLKITRESASDKSRNRDRSAASHRDHVKQSSQRTTAKDLLAKAKSNSYRKHHSSNSVPEKESKHLEEESVVIEKKPQVDSMFAYLYTSGTTRGKTSGLIKPLKEENENLEARLILSNEPAANSTEIPADDCSTTGLLLNDLSLCTSTANSKDLHEERGLNDNKIDGTVANKAENNSYISQENHEAVDTDIVREVNAESCEGVLIISETVDKEYMEAHLSPVKKPSYTNFTSKQTLPLVASPQTGNRLNAAVNNCETVASDNLCMSLSKPHETLTEESKDSDSVAEEGEITSESDTETPNNNSKQSKKYTGSRTRDRVRSADLKRGKETQRTGSDRHVSISSKKSSTLRHNRRDSKRDGSSLIKSDCYKGSSRRSRDDNSHFRSNRYSSKSRSRSNERALTRTSGGGAMRGADRRSASYEKDGRRTEARKDSRHEESFGRRS